MVERAFSPLILAAEDGGTLEERLRRDSATLERLLLQHKAILFRGHRDEGGLEAIAAALFEQRMSYNYRSTPRTHLGSGVYTATEYPRQLSIPQHCENAYQRSWPMKLLFRCVEPATKGGCTPLADMGRVTQMISPQVREEFDRRKVKYVRNYRPRIDLPWEVVFGTTSQQDVERFCVDNGIEHEWVDGGLRTSQVCQAMANHPQTGERLWFNQAHLFHASALDAPVRDVMLSRFGEHGLPRNAYFGDGSPIGEDMLDHVRSAFDAHKVRFEWQKGDVLLVDNMLVSHGRDPYEGPRQVQVCMAHPHSSSSERLPAQGRPSRVSSPART